MFYELSEETLKESEAQKKRNTLINSQILSNLNFRHGIMLRGSGSGNIIGSLEKWYVIL